jgi:solute carrier family 25 S-adenosylmethionine transporter 26
LFDGCYRGITLTLLGNVPAGAVFFAVKDATKAGLRGVGPDLPRWLTTSLSVAVAQIPYWLVRNPTEVVKVRQQADVGGYGDVSAWGAIQRTLRGAAVPDTNTTTAKATTITTGGGGGSGGGGGGLSDFFTGYWENIFYAYPADVIKFVAYEAITKGRDDLSPAEGAQAGAVATAVAQLVTTPLDVVRNRLMTGLDDDGDDDDRKGRGYLESLVSLGRDEGLPGLFAGAGPRVGKAVLSGAIQFATYEETKQSMARWLPLPPSPPPPSPPRRNL